MALPNPFGPSAAPHQTCVQPSFQHKQILNPGPGLPQALLPQYTDLNISNIKKNDMEKKTYSSNRNGFPSSQYSPYSCDRCDRSFKTQELLNHHISEHISCGINGCTFVAHPKIVEKHIEMQHDTGLAEQIMRLNTPEEIQKWREARKKNFPSSSNIARRQAEQKEKSERGEVLNESKRKFAKGKNKREQKWDAKKTNFQKRNRNPKEDTKSEIYKPPIESLPQSNYPKNPHQPAQKTETDVIKKELSEGEIVSDTEVTAVAPSSSNALAFLKGYATDSEEEADAKKAKVEPEEKPTVQTKERTMKRRKKGKPKKKDAATASKQTLRPQRLTLLQKLLEGEVLHERNLILQCVHYIVQQNFFGLEKSATKDVQSNSSDSVQDDKEIGQSDVAISN